MFSRITNVRRKLKEIVLTEKQKKRDKQGILLTKKESEDEKIVSNRITEIYGRLKDPKFKKSKFYRALRIKAHKLFLTDEEYVLEKHLNKYYHALNGDFIDEPCLELAYEIWDKYKLPVPDPRINENNGRLEHCDSVHPIEMDAQLHENIEDENCDNVLESSRLCTNNESNIPPAVPSTSKGEVFGPPSQE